MLIYNICIQVNTGELESENINLVKCAK